MLQRNFTDDEFVDKYQCIDDSLAKAGFLIEIKKFRGAKNVVFMYAWSQNNPFF